MHKEVFMSLYITSQQLSHDTYTQLITAASSQDGFVYYNKKADTYCVSEESLENYKRVSGQRIYELGRKFKTAFNENPAQAKDVSGSLRYFKNLTLKYESERNPLLRLIVKIYQAIRNLFYGYGLRTPATLLDRFASELDAAAETSHSLPEKKIKENESPPQLPKTPQVEEKPKTVPEPEPEPEPEPPFTQQPARNPSPEPQIKSTESTPPPTIKHAHSQRKLTKRQSMNFGKLCIELRLAGDIHQFEAKIKQMAQNGDGIFQLFALDGGPAEKFDDSRRDFLTKILKPLDFDKRKIVVQYLMDFPSFNAEVFCDLFYVIYTYQKPENEYQVTDTMKLLRSYFQNHPETAQAPNLSDEDRSFLSKQSIQVG